MNICRKDTDLLKTIKLYLTTVKPLIETKSQKGRAVKLLLAADDGLEEVRKDLEKLDKVVSNLTDTLNELKKENMNTESKVHTSKVINLKTGKPSAKKTLEELGWRHEKFSKILSYYCHLYMHLHHQIEGQRLANEMKRDGYDGFDGMDTDDSEEEQLKRKAVVAGPHVRKMLQDFVNNKL